MEIEKSLAKTQTKLKALEGILKDASLGELEDVNNLIKKMIRKKMTLSLKPGDHITVLLGREKIKQKVKLHAIKDDVVLVRAIKSKKLGSRYTVPVKIEKIVKE